MKKLVLLLGLCASFLFAEINLQTASREELIAIKGIGPKKADQIIEYRKTNKITSAEDLKKIKGFGNSVVNNVKNADATSKDSANKKELNSSVDKKSGKTTNSLVPKQ